MKTLSGIIRHSAVSRRHTELLQHSRGRLVDATTASPLTELGLFTLKVHPAERMPLLVGLLVDIRTARAAVEGFPAPATPRKSPPFAFALSPAPSAHLAIRKVHSRTPSLQKQKQMSRAHLPYWDRLRIGVRLAADSLMSNGDMLAWSLFQGLTAIWNESSALGCGGAAGARFRFFEAAWRSQTSSSCAVSLQLGSCSR